MPLITTFGAGSVRGLGRAARLVPPGAPTSFSATGRTRLDGAGGANVYWTAPADNGGAPITSYQVQNVSTMAVSTVYNPGEVVSLSNNVEQGFRIRAVNAAGPGEWSNTDLAVTGYWTYNPSNGGGSTTFTVPSGISSFVYQLYSNSGASSKPDTRTYTNAWPRQSLDWWGPETIGYYSDFGVPYWWDYHRHYDGWNWYNYDPNWNYMSGYLSYGWGNIQSGSHEYYYMYSNNSGPSWSSGQHYGWVVISPSAQQVQTGGSPAQGPTSGGSSTINVPGWGSDNSGGGYGGTSSTTSGTAYANPGTNVTVNIGASNGDYSYSSPGYAVIAYGR